MFYSAQILSKKGPLGIIWIAASLGEKKLNRKQVYEANIAESIGEPDPRILNLAPSCLRQGPL